MGLIWKKKDDPRIEILLTELIKIVHASLAADGEVVPIEDIVSLRPSQEAGIWEIKLKTQDA